MNFTVSGSSLARFKKDIYGITNIDNLSGDEKKKAEKYLNSTPEEVYEYLRSGKSRRREQVICLESQIVILQRIH